MQSSTYQATDECWVERQLCRVEQSDQAQTAKLFGVTQPRVSDMLRGKINLFGLDALVNLAAAAAHTL